jgi:hypothetical protein
VCNSYLVNGNLHKLVLIILMSFAGAERSFSAMKCVKSYLRSTMICYDIHFLTLHGRLFDGRIRGAGGLPWQSPIQVSNHKTFMY